MTHEEFLKKLWDKNEHYRNGNFEVVGEYTDSNKHLIIKNKYGECRILSETLITKNSNASRSIALCKTEYFKNELLDLNEHYANKRFEIIGEYKGSGDRIDVLTPYGECSVPVASLVAGCSVGIETAKKPESYFLMELSFQNNHLYNQILSIEGFSNMNTKCNILTKYGWVNVTPMELKRLKNFNILSALNKTEYFLNRCKEERKDFNNVDYTDAVYYKTEEKLNLRCKIHNYKYNQKAGNHIKGVQGCPFCMGKVLMYNRDNIKQHKDFLEKIQGVLYIVKLSNGQESFYKVGITAESRFDYRMNQLKKSYNLYIEYTEYSNMVDIYNQEQNFLKEFKNYRYNPLIKFKGYTECLSINPLNAYGFWEEELRATTKN
jgi:hypothetical protein